jgi:hypothetical protein
MDALVHSLRFFARMPNDPNSVRLGELRIREYLRSATASLQMLSNAIDEEARASQGANRFWIKMQGLVQSRSNEQGRQPTFLAD